MITRLMPSPIGHLLAGVSVALAAQTAARPISWRFGAACAVLAALPDADLAVAPALHRTVTHSVTSALVLMIIAAGVTGWVTRSADGRPMWPQAWRVGLICGLAWASHLVLDWLGSDPSPPRGIQLLWPFSERWFISGANLFPGTERRNPFTLAATIQNARAALFELVLMGTIAGTLWWARHGRSGRWG
jgi:membrane-bound metal-dependent hydrolase YbcI (DUF457 family)